MYCPAKQGAEFGYAMVGGYSVRLCGPGCTDSGDVQTLSLGWPWQDAWLGLFDTTHRAFQPWRPDQARPPGSAPGGPRSQPPSNPPSVNSGHAAENVSGTIDTPGNNTQDHQPRKRSPEISWWIQAQRDTSPYTALLPFPWVGFMIVRAGRSSSVTCGKSAVPHLGWSVVGSGVLRVVEVSIQARPFEVALGSGV